MRWLVSAFGTFVALAVCTTVLAKPSGHVTEERREYYHKTSKVIDTPIVFPVETESQRYTSSSDALSSSWARSHMDEIKRMADKLRSEYNFRAQGHGSNQNGYQIRHGYSSGSTFQYPSFTGKSQQELDTVARQMTEKMVQDMKSGKLLNSQVAQPDWFESQAAQQLESLSHTQNYNSQQEADNRQRQGSIYYGVLPGISGGGYHRTEDKKHYEYSSSHSGYQPIPTYATEIEDLNRKEEQSSIVYPTTVTIIGGKRYVTKKNCSSSSSTVGSPPPYFTNFQTQSSTYDKNILEKGRTIPIVIEQGESKYSKEDKSVSKQQEHQSVPVYPGSYFTDDQYDSQYSQSFNQNTPVQSQTQKISKETEDKSQYNRHYQQIPITGGSQTIRTSSTVVRERENHQVPAIIPTRQTITSSSDSFGQTQTQRQSPIIFPSSSTHRESSSYESVREHQTQPKPTPSSSYHSIYKHLQSESESIPDYKPIVTIDSQTIESANQETNKYFPQRPSTIARTEESHHVEEERRTQQRPVIPDITLTIHEQETTEGGRDQKIQSTRPTIATSQQTTTNEAQQSSVLYRPNYPAYGSQINRNDTEYHRRFESRYPQQTITGSTHESREEDHYSREHQQQVPIFGQTSQNTEEMSTSETYRTREQQTPVVVGGSTSHQESYEQHYTDEHKQQPVPQTYQTSTSHQGSYEQQYTDEHKQQPAPQTYQTSEEINQTDHTTTQQRQRPIYVSGGSSHAVETEDQTRESTRYRQYPTGHRTSQIISESEDAYWSSQRSRPQSVQTSQSETESEYSESSRTRYPQGGVVTSQTTQEQETIDQDIRHKPGQPGYIVTSSINETTSKSSGENVASSQHPVIITESHQTTEEAGNQGETQVVVQPGYGGVSSEKNESSVEMHESGAYYPSGSDRSREQTDTEYERQHERRPQGGGGVRLEHTEYGSQVNRNMTTGGATIGYITHQLTIEEQEAEWRRQEEERRRQQLISTGIFEESSLNRSSSYGDSGQVQINVAQQGVYDGDEDRLSNGTAHLDQAHYGSSADKSSSSASGKPPGKIISKDRGDQPPQTYEEDYDMNEAEPGIGYYPSEPQVGNQQAETATTPEYPRPYVAPLAPITVDKDKLVNNQQTTVEVLPTTAGETEVQRTYHRKKTTITQTIPVLLGPHGEIIQEAGSSSLSSVGQQQGASSSGNYQSSSSGGSYQSSSGGSFQSSSSGNYQTSGENYQSQLSEGTSLTSGSLTKDQEEQALRQAFESQSSSHQSAGGRGGYGSTLYGSEARYSSKPSAGSSGSNGARYTTGSSSSSVSYQSGGSFSQASAYGQQEQDEQEQADTNFDDQGQQETVETFGVEGGQQVEDLTQQFDDQDVQVLDNLQQVHGQREEDEIQSHGSYAQLAGESDYNEQMEGQSSSTYYQNHHASYSSQRESSSSNSSSGSTSSSKPEESPVEVQDEEISKTDQEKPGFWKRIGQKAKELFG